MQISQNAEPEFALLAECCRAGFDPARASAVAARAISVDWSRLVALARRHRVEGLTWRSLNLAGIDLPDEARSLGADARAIATQGLVAARECARLRDALDMAKIALLFVKGLTVGKLAYGDAFVKMAWDIDLLVAPSDVRRAAGLLEKLGYALAAPSLSGMDAIVAWHRTRKETVWRKTDDGLTVELHSRLADRDELIPDIKVSSPRQEVMIGPGIVLPTLERDPLFAYLCVHGASSGWFRLKWIADLAGLLHECPPAEIDRLYRRSLALGAGRAPAQALLLASTLFDVSLGEQLESELRASPINRWLARAALDLLQSPEPNERPLGTAMIHLTQFALLRGLRFKLAELIGQVQATTAPR